MKKNYDLDIVKKHIPLEDIPDEVRVQYLRPGELLSIHEKFPVAFQPLGTIEWHGRHNPLGCDAIKVEQLSIEVAKQIGGVVMPPIYFATDAYNDTGKGLGLGMDPSAGFQLPGSFYQIDTNLYKQLIINACQNYLNRGFKFVVLISGHNAGTQQFILNEVCYHFKTDDLKEPVISLMEFTALDDNDPLKECDHAAYYETSMMLYHNGKRVNMDANKNQQIEDLAIDGRPYKNASYEDGKLFFNAQVKALKKLIQTKLKDLE